MFPLLWKSSASIFQSIFFCVQQGRSFSLFGWTIPLGKLIYSRRCKIKAANMTIVDDSVLREPDRCHRTSWESSQSLLKTCGKQCKSPYPHLQYEHPFWTHSPCGITPQSLRRSSYSQLLPVKYFGQAQKLPKMHVPPFLQQVRLCLATPVSPTNGNAASALRCWRCGVCVFISLNLFKNSAYCFGFPETPTFTHSDPSHPDSSETAWQIITANIKNPNSWLVIPLASKLQNSSIEVSFRIPKTPLEHLHLTELLSVPVFGSVIYLEGLRLPHSHL